MRLAWSVCGKSPLPFALFERRGLFSFATRCLKPRAERRASEAVKSGAAKRGCGVASRSQAPKAAWMLILESSHRKPGPQGYTLLEDTSRSTQLMLGLPAWSSHFLTEPRKQGRVAGHSARRMNKICAMHRAQALAECPHGKLCQATAPARLM